MSAEAPSPIFSPKDDPRIARPPAPSSKHRRWAKRTPSRRGHRALWSLSTSWRDLCQVC